MIVGTVIGTVNRAAELNRAGTICTFTLVARSRTPSGMSRRVQVQCRLTGRRAGDLAPLLIISRRVVAIGTIVPVGDERFAALEMTVDELEIEGKRRAPSEPLEEHTETEEA